MSVINISKEILRKMARDALIISFLRKIDRASVHLYSGENIGLCRALERRALSKKILSDYLSPDYEDTDTYWLDFYSPDSQDIRYTLLLFYKEISLELNYE